MPVFMLKCPFTARHKGFRKRMHIKKHCKHTSPARSQENILRKAEGELKCTITGFRLKLIS